MAGEETTNQGNIRPEFNVATTGLNLDQSLNQISKGSLTYALNAAVENFDGNSVNYQNEPGNELCLNFPDGYQLIGDHSIYEKNKHIFFLANPETGGSEIGYMDNNDCVYHTLVNAVCLNFNINNPIHKVVHRITNCTTEIYWTDGVNPRRYLDIENIPYKPAYGSQQCDPIESNELDCNRINIQPNFSIPEIRVSDVKTGGDLKAGTYQFGIQYSDVSGNGYSSYYSITNPTPIANLQLTTPAFDYSVGKSIELSISNLDISGQWQYFNLAVIKTINGATSVELVGTYFIDNSQTSITYTGQRQIDLTLLDIYERFPYYEIAQDLTAVRDILVWDQLTSIDRINYQQIANQITLQWETYRIPADENYADELNATNLRGYLRDEVYAFEIVFLLANGKQTDGFHIPGRVATQNDLVIVYPTNQDFIGEVDPLHGGAHYWKIYNTGSVSGFSSGYDTSSSYKGPYQYGEFSYWESTDKYPCNKEVWGELADKPIRHHKFPDVLVSPIFESAIFTSSSGMAIQKNAVFPIGVRVDLTQIAALINSSGLTQQQKDSIVGFKIVRGDRSTNKSIVAKGILRNVGKYQREGTEYYYPNYPYNDIKQDPFLLSNNNAYTTNSGAVSCKSYIITVTGLDVSSQVFIYQYIDCYTNTLVEGISRNVGEEIRVCALNSPVPTITLGTGTVVENVAGTPACNPSSLNGFSSIESQYRHVFNSPETSFGQPFLGNVLKLESVIYGAGKAHFVQVKNNAQYKLLSKEAQQDAITSSEAIANITGFNALVFYSAYQAYLTMYINGITKRNYAYSFNSIASYDYSSSIGNAAQDPSTGVVGLKQRNIDIAQYLIPGVQSVGDDKNINNFQRESSIYIKTDSNKTALPFPDKTPSIAPSGTPTVTDDSRFTISQKGNCSNLAKEVQTSVVSYYASLKNEFVNQWGQIYSYNTIDTGFQRDITPLTSPVYDTVFGGDTFISKFAFKTKLPFFIDNTVNSPDDADVYYDELGNVAYPKYWFSSRSVLTDAVIDSIPMKNFISFKAHNLDCPNSQTPANSPGRTYYDGKMYLFAYGVPYFYCETSYNVDLRQAFNNKEGDFWPHVSTGIPDDWVQESYVSIANDNTYYYNPTFSKQNRETVFTHLPADWTPDLCATTYPFRAIYSDPQDTDADANVNNWLIYRAVSKFDFPQNYGSLISLDGIQNQAVLARFENKTLLYNQLLTIDTSNPKAAYIGNDKLFASAPPVDYAETDLGYVGSQNKMLLKIPQGQITVDAKRGQVFLIQGTQVKDISQFGSGMNRWLTDHLFFEILKYFPNVDTDNHYTGVGLHGTYDSKYDRVLITKLDYIPKRDDIVYDATDKKFYLVQTPIQGEEIREEVYLTDEDYFCNRSWTLSFNINTNSWISFHTYLPNFYIAENNFFYSGLNDCCSTIQAIVAEPINQPTTTSTTTLDCALRGTADVIQSTTTTSTTINCNLAGNAVEVQSTSTTTSTTTLCLPPTWTVSNADCGLGTVNDVGINGTFMNTLDGPSTFPLTTGLYGNKLAPAGVVNGLNVIQLNLTTNLAGTGNCLKISIYKNGEVSPSYYTFVSNGNPFPQITVPLTVCDAVSIAVSCLPGTCPDNTTTTTTTISTSTSTTTTTTTATPTTTTTTTTQCCTFYDLTISSTDTNDATGNLIFQNNVVYASYINCQGAPASQVYTPGTYNNTICVKANTLVNLVYYKSDVSYTATYSTKTNTFICCTETPTTTTTTTAYCEVRSWTLNSTGDGASWTYNTACPPAPENESIITLSGADQALICSSTTPVLVSGTGSATLDLVNTCGITTTTTTTVAPPPTTTTTTTPTPTTTTTTTPVPTTTTTTTPTPTTTTTTTLPPSTAWIMGGAGAGFGSSGAACGSSTGGPTLYTAIPYTGNFSVFYTNAALTIPFNGGSLWYKVYNTVGAYTLAVQINSAGVQTSSVSCDVTTTTTTTAPPTTTTTTTPTPTTTTTTTPTPCCAPTLGSPTVSGGNINIGVTYSCGSCVTLLVEYSTDLINWSSSAGGCLPTIVLSGTPSVTTYYRARIVCPGSINSAYSNVVSYVPPTTTTTTTTQTPTTTTTTTQPPTTTTTTTAAPVFKYTFVDSQVASGSFDCGDGFFGFYTLNEVTITIYNSTCTATQTSHPNYVFTLEQFGSDPTSYPNVYIPNGNSVGTYSYTAQDSCTGYYSSVLMYYAPIAEC